MSHAAAAQAHDTGQPTGDEMIRAEGLSKVYAGSDVRAVDALDLAVRAGEVFGLLGPNGAGKTTTAGMLTTRVVPTAGRAWVAGVDVVAQPALAKQVLGVVSQQNTLDRALTVEENRTRLVDGGVELLVKGAERLLPRVVLAADQAGFDVVDLSVAEPSLETVFINLTGKELRE